MECFNILPPEKQLEVNKAFAHGHLEKDLAGRLLLYRFIGFDKDGEMAKFHGPWWFSEKVLNDLKMRSKSLGVSFRDFAKAKLALPDAFNDRLHVFEMTIPEGKSVPALQGRVNYQRMNGKSLSEDENRDNGDNVLLIGGYDQYFLDPRKITEFPLRQILIRL